MTRSSTFKGLESAVEKGVLKHVASSDAEDPECRANTEPVQPFEYHIFLAAQTAFSRADLLLRRILETRHSYVSSID